MQHRLHFRDRRSIARGTSLAEPSRTELVNRILGMYREMPGLSLYLRQAARLFGISVRTCQVVLEQLVASRALYVTDDGRYTAI